MTIAELNRILFRLRALDPPALYRMRCPLIGVALAAYCYRRDLERKVARWC
jgi:hypothetical protein